MQKKNIKLFVIIGAIILCCFFSTIAYSAIYTTMGISGLAYTRPIKDVRVTDFKLNNLQGGASVSYTEFSKNTLSLNVNILDNSSKAVFDVEITNYGSADIGILQIVDKSSSGAFFNILNYEYGNKLCDSNGKCNNMAVSTIQIEVRGSAGEHNVNLEVDFRTFHSVTYTGITNNGYPTEVMDGCYLSVNFKESLKRISVLSGGTEIDYYDSISSGETINVYNISDDIEFKYNEPVAKLISGKIDEVGSEVCIKDECFYIISNDGSTVTMLAKYNLHVGNEVADSRLGVSEINDATGIQSDSAVGSLFNESNNPTSFPWVGTIAFSNVNYWYSNGLKSDYGLSYPSYVYDSNSNVYTYVEDYSNYLKNSHASLINARLITYDELDDLGCDFANESCSDAPDWVYATTYWSGVAYSDENVRIIFSNSILGYNTYNNPYLAGIRPVIEISIDEIYVPIIEFTVDDETYQALEGMIWEEWIDSTYNTGDFYVKDDYIYKGIAVLIRGTEAVHLDDVIENNQQYTWYFSSTNPA